MTKISAPTWDLTSAYESIESELFKSDIDLMSSNTTKLKAFCESLAHLDLSSDQSLGLLEETIVLQQKTSAVSRNLELFVWALQSIDTTVASVQAMYSQISTLASNFLEAGIPLDNFIIRADSAVIEKLLQKESLKAFRFHWQRLRLKNETLLSDQEEQLIQGLYPSGHLAWMDLYYNIVGSTKCQVEFEGKTQEMGLAETYAIMYGNSEPRRKSAYEAIQKAWKSHEVSASAIINALAGWRLELVKKRSFAKKVDFLTETLFENRINAKTLEALITCCRKNLKEVQRAPRAMARFSGKEKLDPWDMTASCPPKASNASTLTPFAEASEIITKSFNQVSPDMAAFVGTMSEKSWIDAQMTEKKSTGGFCFEFTKAREPRVFVSYGGSSQDIATVAHELGHAYHYWVMRDLELCQSQYPSTLAETASVFGETAYRDYLTSNSKDKAAKLEAGWSEMESIMAYLIDAPSRFEFEKKFHERRLKQTLNAQELCQLMDETRTEWFGETFSSNDTMFWASKLHFSSVGAGFYNYPYTFGYLFALGLYARRKERGEAFNETYLAILRDTGRMTAEDLIQKHLGEDIQSPEFWQKSVDIVIEKIISFEELLST